MRVTQPQLRGALDQLAARAELAVLEARQENARLRVAERLRYVSVQLRVRPGPELFEHESAGLCARERSDLDERGTDLPRRFVHHEDEPLSGHDRQRSLDHPARSHGERWIDA